MRIRNIFAAALLGTAAFAATAADARINQRQGREQARIHHGVQSGQLTARETYRLEREQAHIARYEAASRADGGGLSYRERYRIERMQDRASRDIYRQRHDGQAR